MTQPAFLAASLAAPPVPLRAVRLAAAALAALSCILPAAHAASQASAQIIDLQVGLTDLDSFDGADPSYGWVTNATSGQTILNTSASDSVVQSSSSRSRAQALYQQGLSSDSDSAHAHARIGSNYAGANGRADGGASAFSASAETGSKGVGTLGDLLIAAHTKVTITAKASVFAFASNPGGGAADWAQSFARLGLSLDNGASFAMVSTLSAAAASQGYFDFIGDTSVWVPGTSMSDSREGDLTLTYENKSDAARLVSVSWLTSVSGVGAAAMPAVPEAESAALALVGVGALVAVARRERRHSAQARLQAL